MTSRGTRERGIGKWGMMVHFLPINGGGGGGTSSSCVVRLATPVPPYSPFWILKLNSRRVGRFFLRQKNQPCFPLCISPFKFWWFHFMYCISQGGWNQQRYYMRGTGDRGLNVGGCFNSLWLCHCELGLLWLITFCFWLFAVFVNWDLIIFLDDEGGRSTGQINL